MSQLFLESVSEEQLHLLRLIDSLDVGTLVGGTALSLQIGHRKSYDLDFVTDTFTHQKVAKIQSHLGHYQLKQLLLNDTQYTAYVQDVKITLFLDTAPFLHGFYKSDGFRLVSAQDIFSTKLFILGKRATWRDYCDIAILIEKEKFSLKQGITEATQRYSVAERWVLEPLTYFNDVEMLPVEWIGKQYSEDEIQAILRNATEEYLNG